MNSDIQIEESSDEEENEEEELEIAVFEMKQLIKYQHISKASKYQHMIGESAELSEEDIKIGSEDENYESLKNEVIHILQKKIDMKNYKNAIK